MGMNGVGFTPTKNIRPISYNGVRSTGFKGVQVFQSHTTINRTIEINEGNSNSGSKKSSFWGKFLGILTGAAAGLGIMKMIGKLSGKKEDDGAGANDDINNRIEQEKQKTEQKDKDKKTVTPDKTYYGGQLSAVEVLGKANKAKKPLTAMDANMKQDVAEEAKDLQGIYSGVIKNINVEKQSDGTYKIRIVVPDTLKYNGDTAALTGTCKNSEELYDLVDKALGQLLTPDTAKNNPFTKPTS